MLETSEDFCPASERRLKKLKRAAAKEQPEGVYRYIRDNEGFDDGVVKIYPKNEALESHVNYGYQGDEVHAYSNAGTDQKNPYSTNHM